MITSWREIASNDDCYFLSKTRGSPIKSSIETISGLPTSIKIFKYAGEKFWQVRYFAFGEYFIKSLGATTKDDAIVEVYKFYADNFSNNAGAIIVKAKDNENQYAKDALILKEIIFQLLTLEKNKVERDEIKFESYLMLKGRLEGFIFEFFSKKQLSLLNLDSIEEFVNYLTKKKLSGPTIQGYLAACKKLLKILFRNQIISQIPLMPYVKAQYRPRGAFTPTEYRLIVLKARELRGVKFDNWPLGKRIWIKESYQIMPNEMQLLIRFMVYTFLRPGDIRQLKHKHIEVIRGKFNYLRLSLPEVKRHNAPVVSLAPAITIYEKLKENQEKLGYGSGEDYLFFPSESDRKLALSIAGWLFNWILDDLNLKQGPHGSNRSLYSLRHTAITFRLIYGGGIDLLTLARNSRTSVEMIEKFYASTLAAERNISLLQSRRIQ